MGTMTMVPPPLPERVDPAALQQLDDDGLSAAAGAIAAAEREIKAAMAPFERELTELRARAAEVATERRRRERSAQVEKRRHVREAAASGEAPTLIDALADSDIALAADRSLADITVHLKTGGEVRFGFATRPGTVAFTNGRDVSQATTWGEAQQLFAYGLEPGTPAVAGVRVHLVGTRVERVVPADELTIGVG